VGRGAVAALRAPVRVEDRVTTGVFLHLKGKIGEGESRWVHVHERAGVGLMLRGAAAGAAGGAGVVSRRGRGDWLHIGLSEGVVRVGRGSVLITSGGPHRSKRQGFMTVSSLIDPLASEQHLCRLYTITDTRPP